MSRIEVLSGPERRRRWNAEQKRSIVAEAFAPGASVCEVARRRDVVPGQIYRWRRDLRAAARSLSRWWSRRDCAGRRNPNFGLLFYENVSDEFTAARLPTEILASSCCGQVMSWTKGD